VSIPDGVYPVEKVVDVRNKAGTRKADEVYEYLVTWEGYDDSENTWEPHSEDLLPHIMKYLDAMRKDSGLGGQVAIII